MKRSLAALALAGCAGFASAQGLTMYGVVDVGIGYARQAGRPSDLTVDSGIGASTLVGIRAIEEIPNGLKASFRLEHGFQADDGTLEDEDRFFDRAAWIGLLGRYGELRLGRQATIAEEWFSQVSPFENDFKQAGGTTVFGDEEVGERIDNAVFYYSPSVGGFTAGVGYSFNDDGPEIPGQDNAVLSIGLRYSGGPAMAVISYGVKRDADDDAASGRGDISSLSIGGTYDFDRFKLHAAYGRLKHRDFRRSARPENTWLVGATVPIGEGELLAGYQRASGRNANELDDDSRRDGFALAYRYSLSNRTAVYTYGSRFRNVEPADQTGGPVHSTEFGFGVQHEF